jgi:AcrR family transcriptional regulator
VTGAPPRPAARAGLTRESVVRAAADLADRIGFHRVTVSEVAREAGVRSPSLYSHVRGTDDLAAAVTELALTEIADRGGRALAGRSGRDALLALATMYRDYARRHPGRFEAANALRAPTGDGLAAAAARVSAQTAAVLRGYPVAEDEQVHAVRLIASVLRGFIQLEAGGAFGHRAPTSEASWQRALAVLDDALRHWGPAR